MENYKLKHLSKFCCKPDTEAEYEFIKSEAQINNVLFWDDDEESYEPDACPCIILDEDEYFLLSYFDADKREVIPVLDFINKLRMTEEEAEKLEDDRVELFDGEFRIHHYQSDDGKSYIAKVGHYFKTNEDGTEATLHKR